MIVQTAHYKLVNEGKCNKFYLKSDCIWLDEDILINVVFTSSNTLEKGIEMLNEYEKNHF